MAKLIARMIVRPTCDAHGPAAQPAVTRAELSRLFAAELGRDAL